MVSSSAISTIRDITVSVWVRQDRDRKHKGKGFKGCNCWKHLYEPGTCERYSAKTRSWTRAEEIARQREKELAGEVEPRIDDDKSITVAAAAKAYVDGERARNLSQSASGTRQPITIQSACDALLP